jgi:hypothetical protein
MDEYQRYIIHEKWDDLIKMILVTAGLALLKKFCDKQIRNLVYKERREEVNKVFSSRIVRFSLLKISLTVSLFLFIYFLDYKYTYEGFIDLFFYHNFTDFRWDVIHIAVRKTVIFLILEGLVMSAWGFYKGKLKAKNFTQKRSEELKLLHYYKNRNDQDILNNELKIDDAYSDIIHILLLTFIFGMAIPELFIFSIVYISVKWRYFKFFCKFPIPLLQVLTARRQ